MTPAMREILQQGFEQGFKQGFKQGIEQGERMQAEKSALQILQKKFGILSEDERNAVGKLSLKELEDFILDSLDFSERKELEERLAA